MRSSDGAPAPDWLHRDTRSGSCSGAFDRRTWCHASPRGDPHVQPDVDRFLERFSRFGAAPSVATYLGLFDPEATLFDSGMPRPIRVPEIPEHTEGILRLVPAFRMAPERWRVRGTTLFVEAKNQASLAGKPL